MALTAQEILYLNFALGTLPGWVNVQDEFLFGTAKMFGGVHATAEYLWGQSLISTAEGATATTPDWLHQHARDRGTGRRSGEDDPTLRARIRSVPDLLTRAAVISAANAILVAAGGSADAALVELPRDGAYWGDYESATGTGGVFGAPDVDDIQSFTPDVSFPRAPRPDTTDEGWDWLLETTGADDPNNDVTDEPIVAVVGNAARFENAAGSADSDVGVAWTAKKRRWGTIVADEHPRFYWGRGYRWNAAQPPLMIMILPFGTSDGTAASVLEALRQKKAAGFVARVEVRAVP